VALLPELTPENTAFWTGGEQGKLMIAHCDACSKAIHPPELDLSSLSESFGQRKAGFRLRRGADLYRQPPAMDARPKAPYVLAIVAIDGAEGVRVTAQLVDTDPGKIAVGMRVRAVFEQVEEIWIPRFRPVDPIDPPVRLGFSLTLGPGMLAREFPA
jgi:uncharacterized OB-fold protein